MGFGRLSKDDQSAVYFSRVAVVPLKIEMISRSRKESPILREEDLMAKSGAKGGLWGSTTWATGLIGGFIVQLFIEMLIIIAKLTGNELKCLMADYM